MGFTAQQIAAFSTSGAACAGFTSSQVPHMNVSAFSGFFTACIRSSTDDMWSTISATQITEIPPSAFAGKAVLIVFETNEISFDRISVIPSEQLSLCCSSRHHCGTTKQYDIL